MDPHVVWSPFIGDQAIWQHKNPGTLSSMVDYVTVAAAIDCVRRLARTSGVTASFACRFTILPIARQPKKTWPRQHFGRAGGATSLLKGKEASRS